MRRFGPIDRWLAVAIVLPLLLVGCVDDRGPVSPPDGGILNGNGLYNVSRISSFYYAVQNAFVAIALELNDDPAFSSTSVLSCHTDDPQNAARIVQDATDPDLYKITFGGAPPFPFIVNCGVEQLSFLGTMSIRFLQTEGSLVYEVILPFNHVTGLPEAVTMTLPGAFGSTPLRITAPNGPLLATLSGVGGSDRDGVLNISGTLRLEDRSQPFLVIQELSLEYNMVTLPSGEFQFATWPAGSAMIVTHSPPQQGAGIVAAFPSEVFFDGLGGLFYEVGPFECDANMATNDNPCANI